MTNKEENWNRCVWKIENFTFCWHKTSESILSPEFYMLGLYWSLQIFPRGNHDSNWIACYLKTRHFSKNQIIFKLACLDLDGAPVEEWKSYDGTCFSKSLTYGSGTFIFRSDVFAINRKKFLPNDTLTICCYISKNSFYPRLNNVLLRTHIEVLSQTIENQITGFSSIVLNIDQQIFDITQTSLENTIQNIKFSAVESPCCDESLIIEIFFDKNKQRKFSTCNVFLLDAAGTKVKCGKSDISFDTAQTEQVWKFPLIFRKWELMAKKELYLPDDTLTLSFECCSSMGTSKEALESTSELSHNSAYSASASVGESSALEELGNLYKEKILCDVDLHTSSKTFPAHKAILSVRSPVFKAMFTNDLKEKITNRVDIEDLDDETVHRLLLYIYANTVKNLQWQVASQLYVAADKYYVENLKKKCSSILKAELCLSNLCEILELADRHQDVYLKNSVQDYIYNHDRYVIGSDKWKDFEMKNPQLTSKTMRYVYRKVKGF